MPDQPQRHFTNDVLVPLESIPSWQGRPQGKPPWVRTACGRFVSKGITTTKKDRVTCALCRKTGQWMEA